MKVKPYLEALEYPVPLFNLAKTIKQSLKKDWDQVIAVTGLEGAGKSTIEIILGFLIDPEFDLDENMSYLPTYKEVIGKYHNIKQYSVLGIDEAIKVLHKHKWAEKLQIALNEVYATERFQNKCTLLCMPRFIDFNERFRNHRIRIWIHVLARGIAVAYVRDPDKDTEDPWHLKQNIKLKEKYFKNKPVASREIQEWLAAERKTVNYLCDFTFSDLPEPLKEEYYRLKTLARKEQTEEAIGIPIQDRVEAERVKQRNAILLFLEYNERLPKELRLSHIQIAEKIGCSATHINTVATGLDKSKSALKGRAIFSNKTKVEDLSQIKEGL